MNEVVFDEIEEVIDTTASEEISNPEIEAADEKVIEENIEEKEEVTDAVETVTESVLQSDHLPDENQMAQYFIKRPGGVILGGFMELFGFFFSVMFAAAFICVAAVSVVLPGVSLFYIGMMTTAVLAVLCLLVGIKGRTIRSRAKRFKKYKSILNGREFCSVEEFADELDKTPEFVVKDLSHMIEHKWFLQGHLDSKQKYLMVTDVMYEQYTSVMDKIPD